MQRLNPLPNPARRASGTMARDDTPIFENPANDADPLQAGDSLPSGAPVATASRTDCSRG